MADMKFEVANLQDAAELVDLVHSAYRGEGSKRGWTTEADILDGTRTSTRMLSETMSRPEAVILKCVDEDTGRIIGCVELIKVNKKGATKCYTGMLTVSPELQARGIGKKLLRASEEWARAEGCVALTMTVISVRVELIAWYKRHGFVDTGDREPFPTKPDFGIPKQKLEFIVLDKML